MVQAPELRATMGAPEKFPLRSSTQISSDNVFTFYTWVDYRLVMTMEICTGITTLTHMLQPGKTVFALTVIHLSTLVSTSDTGYLQQHSNTTAQLGSKRKKMISQYNFQQTTVHVTETTVRKAKDRKDIEAILFQVKRRQRAAEGCFNAAAYIVHDLWVFRRNIVPIKVKISF